MEWWQILIISLSGLILLLIFSVLFYKQFFKRFWDFVLSFLALIVLLPLVLILMLVGFFAMKGNPFFVQKRPGRQDKNGTEKIFGLLKFRTMSNEKDSNGRLLPDERRLNSYGKFLRLTSLDELPELFNVLVGQMSLVGPRPLLIEYLPFYTTEERKRQFVRPGITGLAQINGRNALDWDTRLSYDTKYVQNVSLLTDFKIFVLTFSLVLKHKGVAVVTSEEGNLAEIRSKRK